MHKQYARAVGTSALAVAAVLSLLALHAVPAGAATPLVAKGERKCATKLGKAAAKFAATVAKQTAQCRNADISDKAAGSCPNARNLAKIARAAQKIAATAASRCVSSCSLSGVSCLGSHLCPPLDGSRESCSGGVETFDIRNLGFPGPFCESVLGGPMLDSEDLSACVTTLLSSSAAELIDLIYGSLDNSSGVSRAGSRCLSAISQAGRKLTSTITKGVVKCRNAINAGKSFSNPLSCTSDDVKLAAKIAKAETKLSDTVAGKCDAAAILELDLCGSGVGATTSVASAQTCLLDALGEVADSAIPAALRQYSTRAHVESAYPPLPACGDGVVNQLPNPFRLIGEECDGADDSACPGQCIPPGDLFECTCGDIARVQLITDGFASELDSGWTGLSHNSGVTDGAGFIQEVSGCDCTQLDGFECVGTTTDSVCDQVGHQEPSCSWDPFSGTRCDAHGNGNSVDEDSDCSICDRFSANADTPCTDSNDCTAQCIDGTGAPTGLCPGGQGDCGAGEVCRGQCDQTQTCLLIPLGAPLPISSGGTPTCVVNVYREDVVGTTNIVTGERDSFSRHFSRVHLGESNAVPCPMCGGFCDGGGLLEGDNCDGTCSGSSARCRFDTDCAAGETCTTASPDCPEGFCNLSLVCSSGPSAGLPCRIGADTPLFGTTSLDCLPSPGLNLSGNGLPIGFQPASTEPQLLASTVACTAGGFELFDCPCGGSGGLPSQPNACNFACDAGAELGVGCADGDGSGEATRCEGGANAAMACDEHSDCPGGACSANPTHCSGDPALERFACTTNADCGLGTCVDSCPSGRCVPLCLPSASDPLDGECAAGPTAYNCSGALDSFRTCTEQEATGGCSASCSGAGTACQSDAECPSGETCQGPCQRAQLCAAGTDGILGTFDDLPGAGLCAGNARACYLDPITGEGGDIFNGNGDPNDVNAVAIYCVAATNGAAVNTSAGLPGPGRLRLRGVIATNGFTSLP